jgi:serine/threonine-protein kinase
VSDDSSLEPGTLLGKYQIVCRLGSGGMGSVYEAVHVDIAKPVAIKTLSMRLASEPRAQARFLREAAAACRLNHPHVVDVTDYGAEAGITFIAMELLRGEDLGALLAREPSGMAVESTADIMLAVCAGVFAAHEAGVIHRDLKPQNIFLAHTPVGDVVPKVLDFGISKLLDERLSESLTGTGTVMGTTPYLSPEQVAGHPIDGRSDQYTLGVILYECVTGRRPHDGDSLFSIMRSIAEGKFVRPRQLRPDLPAPFEAVILRAMGHPPDRRYESVHALGQALLPFASPKGKVIWSDYFTTERGAAHTAPLPSGRGSHDPVATPLDRPGRHQGHTPGGRLLPSTHTGAQPAMATPTPPPRFGTPYQIATTRRWPAVLGVFVALALLVGGGGWAFRNHLPGWMTGHPDDPADTTPGAPGPQAEPEPWPRAPRAARPAPPSPPEEKAPVPADTMARPQSKPLNPAADDPVWPPLPGATDEVKPVRPVIRPLVPRLPRPTAAKHKPVRVRPLPPPVDPEDAPIIP